MKCTIVQYNNIKPNTDRYQECQGHGHGTAGNGPATLSCVLRTSVLVERATPGQSLRSIFLYKLSLNSLLFLNSTSFLYNFKHNYLKECK